MTCEQSDFTCPFRRYRCPHVSLCVCAKLRRCLFWYYFVEHVRRGGVSRELWSEFCSYVMHGVSPDEAARVVKTRYKLGLE